MGLFMGVVVVAAIWSPSWPAPSGQSKPGPPRMNYSGAIRPRSTDTARCVAGDSIPRWSSLADSPPGMTFEQEHLAVCVRR